MKVEVKNSIFTLTIESTDGTLSRGEIVAVISSASMSPTIFDDLFFKYINDSKTHAEAYERVERIHEQMFTKRKYSSYESFQVSKSKRLKR